MAGAPAQHCHGPTHGTLATKISEFWTYPNPCVKDFRILDLLEPLRQRFPDFEITPEILSIYGIIGRRNIYLIIYLSSNSWRVREPKLRIVQKK